MKVRVDPNKCQGHARCHAMCPEVYRLDKSGYSFVEDKPIPTNLEEKARQGVAACPEHALSIEEAKD